MSEVYIIPGKKGCEKANQLTGIAIIVDALRASATLATLCEKGVKKIITTSPHCLVAFKEDYNLEGVEIYH